MWPPKILKLSRNDNDEPARCATKLSQDFELGEYLGGGAFGRVYKAMRKSDANEYAIKITTELIEDDAETFRQEAKLLAKLSHSNIVRYYNSWIETEQVTPVEGEKMEADRNECSRTKFEKLSQNSWMSDNTAHEDDYIDEYENENNDDDDGDDEETDDSEEEEVHGRPPVSRLVYKPSKKLCIQMELCGKRNLRTVINNNLYLEESRLNKYFREICEGLSYMHKNYIVHRDLKPENIFVTSDDVIKIGDFGLSKQISIENEFEALQNDKLPYGSLSGVCGTPIYIAPEFYNGKKFNAKADIYSLGVTYFEMCSKPMTVAQIKTVFSMIGLQTWKAINFSTNNEKKKFLIKKLLHPNHHQRPTCEQILKILNSDKTIDEIKSIMQENKKVPHAQLISFKKTLKSSSFKKTELTTFFLKAAMKVFELHGGQNISLPTFIPSYIHHSENLTTMLNTNGNWTSVSNTSRVAFSYYVATKKIRNIRRYSTGKSFEEGCFAPTEVQECLFEAVSPEAEDHVADAEMLFIAQEVCDKTFPNDKGKIRLIINHGLIFATLLKHCRISKKDASVFTNIMMNSNIIATTQALSGLELKEEIKSFLFRMMRACPIKTAKELILEEFRGTNNETFAKIDSDLLNTAFGQIETIALNAGKFGVESDILVLPVLINQRHSTGFMFKVTYGDKIIASGGRFDSLIKRCSRTKQTIPLDVSAVEVSFNVENVLELLASRHESSRDVDVVIIAEDKAIAITLYATLLSKEIKCEIVKNSNGLIQEPLFMIQLTEEHNGTLYHVEAGGQGEPREVFTGDWRNETFFEILAKDLAAPHRPF